MFIVLVHLNSSRREVHQKFQLINMKLFAVTLSYAKMVGACEPQPGQSTLNHRNVGATLIFMMIFTSSTCVFVFDINTFEEYALCFFPWITILAVWTGYSINLLQVKDLFEVVKKLEDIVESSM